MQATAEWPTRIPGTLADERKPTRLRMVLAADIRLKAIHFMNSFRVAVLATIAFLVFLEVVVALSAVVFDVSDKALGVIGIVLAALPVTVAQLFVYLKLDGVDVKADTAARTATVAARKADELQEFVGNGGLRDNVKKAISEDRHERQNREAARVMRPQLEARGMPKRDNPEDMGT